ncbi:MAG: hypothetical protein M3440_08885 [Chloroflexota bacterium]|nr:hypothetical protein [Chloroflexota bacterium]
MDRNIPVQNVKLRGDDPGPPRPAPLDVLAVLEVVLDPASTSAAKSDVLRQVRDARERARRERPERDSGR